MAARGSVLDKDVDGKGTIQRKKNRMLLRKNWMGVYQNPELNVALKKKVGCLFFKKKNSLLSELCVSKRPTGPATQKHFTKNKKIVIRC
jgi:hypothetical protein